MEKATQTFATITLQNYFRMYHKLSGMTGTAETEAGEVWTSEDQMISAENCYARPGFIQMGAYDEAYPSKSAAGSLTLKVGERLAAMGMTEKSTLRMSFLAAAVDPDMQIDIMSGDNLLAQVSGIGTDRFGVKELSLDNIDNSTVLTLSAKGKNADTRVFLDDLSVSVVVVVVPTETLVLEFDFANESALSGWNTAEKPEGVTNDNIFVSKFEGSFCFVHSCFYACCMSRLPRTLCAV